MSETPKKIEFMMMKDSAAELVMASRVAFIDSEESCMGDSETRGVTAETYHSFLFNDVNRRVDVVLSGK